MQFSTSTLLALVLSAMGTAYALPSGSGSMSTLAARGGGSCSTGNTQCCNTVQPASEPDTNSALSQANLLELVLKDLSIPVGLGCTPISVLGAGSGGNCANTPVCCSDNHDSGISISCLPIVAQL